MAKAVNEATFRKVIDKIMAVDLESITAVSDKRLYSSDSKVVRNFLKTLGITSRDVGVRSDWHIIVALPEWSPRIERGMDEYAAEYLQLPADVRAADTYKWNELYEERAVARGRMLSILVRAFPNSDDRGDPYTDYSDYVFHVWG